jgi:hypothetical protein
MNLLFTPDDEEEVDLTLDEAEIAVKSQKPFKPHYYEQYLLLSV